MFSLNPGSLCDVCAEEYGPHNRPHSIPCGHVLCLHCCNNILEKTSPRLTPSCPFCRVPFTSDTIRLIRVDFGGSGWSTPRGGPFDVPDTIPDVASDDDVLLLNPGSMKARAEARRLEYKVAKVAAKKCSLEEVTTLQKELQDWLQSDVKRDDQAASLQLSAALLRAIIVNHMAHKQATELAKTVEANLKEKLDDVQAARDQLESELRRMTAQYSAKAQEVQTLRAEMSRLKIRGMAPTLGVPATPPPSSIASAQQGGLISPPRPQTTTPVTTSRSRATSPTSPTSPTRSSYIPSMQSPLARVSAASGHTRSASTIPSHRSMTPAARPASAIPSPYASFAGAEAPRSIPGTQQRLSSPPPPPKMTRSSSSSSDEKEKEKQKEKDRQRHQLIQRWMPSLDAAHSPPSGRFDKNAFAHMHANMTSSTTASMPPPRYKTPLSAQSS